jgi:prolipoprotein diacylglyceryltransferase
VIGFSYSPIVSIGGIALRLDTLALALVILMCLVVAARIARQTPVDPSRALEEPGPDPDEPNRLRADDLLYVAVAALPGAVVGGRLGYALLHLDFYQANPGALFDVMQGGLSLSMGVVGGFLTASIVAGLLGAPAGRWMHALVMPVLLALAGGKLAMALGGAGQGAAWDGAWATAYLGVGPWGSLAPEIPSHPSQMYEAAATVGVLLFMAWLLALGAFARRTGTAFLLGIALWAGARAAVASSWRDPAIVGPLRMEQVVCIVIAAGSIGLLVLVTGLDLAGRRQGRGAAAGAPVAGAPVAGAPVANAPKDGDVSSAPADALGDAPASPPDPS